MDVDLDARLDRLRSLARKNMQLASSGSDLSATDQPQPDEESLESQSSHLTSGSAPQEVLAQQVRSLPPINRNLINYKASQGKAAPRLQLRCYLCETPKQEYSLLHCFSRVVCRGCVNYEGPDTIEQLISAARLHKSITGYSSRQQQQQQPPQVSSSQLEKGFMFNTASTLAQPYNCITHSSKSADAVPNIKPKLHAYSADPSHAPFHPLMNTFSNTYGFPVSATLGNLETRSPTSLGASSPKLASPRSQCASLGADCRDKLTFEPHSKAQQPFNLSNLRDRFQNQSAQSSTNYEFSRQARQQQPGEVISQSACQLRTAPKSEHIENLASSGQNLIVKNNVNSHQLSTFIKPLDFHSPYPYESNPALAVPALSRSLSHPSNANPSLPTSSAAMVAAAANLGNLLANAGHLAGTNIRDYDAIRGVYSSQAIAQTAAYQAYLDQSLRRALYDQQVRNLVHSGHTDPHFSQQSLYSAAQSAPNQLRRLMLEPALEPDSKFAAQNNQNYLHSIPVKADNSAKHNPDSKVQNSLLNPPASDSQHPTLTRQLDSFTKRPMRVDLSSPSNKRIALTQTGKTLPRNTYPSTSDRFQDKLESLVVKSAHDASSTSEKQPNEYDQERQSASKTSAVAELAIRRQAEGDKDYKQSSTTSGKLFCLTCEDPLSNRHFVQCPSVAVHKFCFVCSRLSIIQQRAENGGNPRGSDEDKIYCPSGEKCPYANESTPWIFMNNEIETIFRESSRGRDSSCSTLETLLAPSRLRPSQVKIGLGESSDMEDLDPLRAQHGHKESLGCDPKSCMSAEETTILANKHDMVGQKDFRSSKVTVGKRSTAHSKASV